MKPLQRSAFHLQRRIAKSPKAPKARQGFGAARFGRIALGRVLAATLLTAFAAVPLCAKDLTVFAAASLKTALDRAATQWEAQSGETVTLSYAGSSALARQIAAGAPADLVFLANLDWMDWLEGQGLIAPGSRTAPLSNRLVVIAPKDEASPLDLSDLPARLGSDGRLAMALVEAVPAGVYGKSAFTSLGLWPDLAPRVAQTDNARAALALVATGAAPLGVVYATDAGADDAVAVVADVPPESHPPIRYALARVEGGAGAAFLDYLTSAQGLRHFTDAGFLAVPGP